MLKDPIVFILTAYLSVVYFLLFGWLSAYPVIFSRIHGLNLGENGLCFIPICVGIISGGMIALLFGKRYQQQTEALGHYPPAEERLLPRGSQSSLLCLWHLFSKYLFSFSLAWGRSPATQSVLAWFHVLRVHLFLGPGDEWIALWHCSYSHFRAQPGFTLTRSRVHGADPCDS